MSTAAPTGKQFGDGAQQADYPRPLEVSAPIGNLKFEIAILISINSLGLLVTDVRSRDLDLP